MEFETTVDSNTVSSEISFAGKAPWPPWIIVLVTIIFSILPGGILYALNYERLGVKNRKLSNLVTFTLLFLVLFLAALLNQHAPVTLLGFVISIACAVHFYKTQNPLYQKYRADGGTAGNLLTPLLITIVSVTLIFSVSFGIDSIATQRFDQALTLMSRGEYQKAEEIFVAHLKYDDRAYETYFNLAIIYLETERFQYAETAIKKYLRHYPSDKGAQDLLAEIKGSE